MLAILSCILAVAAVIALCDVVCKFENYAKALLCFSGWGFLVYHSDSQKYFYSLTYRDAVEWLGCSLGDACIFSNWTKEAISVKIV